MSNAPNDSATSSADHEPKGPLSTLSPSTIVILLSAMMFLQFFAWGSWFATLSAAMDTHLLGAFIGGAYEAAPIAAIFAPLFLGLVADRFFASEKVMGALMLLGGVIMLFIPGLAESASTFAAESAAEMRADGSFEAQAFLEMQASENASGKLLVWMILAHLLCYMPTLGLGNTIAFTHIPSQDQFPKIRVWGTIGWIAAGLTLGVLGWSASYNIFWLGAASSLTLGVLCFFLPNTPPPLRGQAMNVRSLLMVDAFKLLGNWNFFVFAVCSTLICIPLAYYYGMTATYLNQTGFVEPGATMTIGQMSEIFFMLLIPFFFRRLGVKNMILIGMACWVARYLLFAFGATDQTTWMLLLAVALHGLCYDFFFVTGFMYTDAKASKEIRGQAQGLLVFLTQGVGMFFGYRIMAGGDLFGFIPLDLTFGKYGAQVTAAPQYVEALSAARGKPEPVSFLESFTQMFSRHLPESLDPSILAETMAQWRDFWLSPAIMAAAIFVLFAVAFWDRTKTSATPESDA
ncbi:MFS transporter [Allorhodopirellula heiligendammensis]|uniref:Nucleoside transporter YegT n=1 Tax=Allorhodopirellula heiligendammensis TaxID=2714739 RepID=A0A5C6C6H4_9BACT|nr:MFS transporter [Allorhodopirellula heiligendammensis]TWU19705.1 putative nucleoside transporter YegT [Allorhodopirellula heiligendammensis]